MNLVALCAAHGWSVECESPLEIRHVDGSFATLAAAVIVIDFLQEYEPEEPLDHSPDCCCGDRDCPGIFLRRVE